MKVVILAGGVGNRLGGETEAGPKPMVEIGGHPLLWHIMSHYAFYGYVDFIIAVGHKGGQIKKYFADFNLAEHDVRIELATGEIQVHGVQNRKDWTVDVVDTGRWTQTGGRVRRLANYVGDETFMLTFGDAVADIDLDRLLELHRSEGRLATITAVHPPPRFGELMLDDDRVREFSEKPMDAGWINGGYMVLEPGVLDYIDSDRTPLAPEPMQKLVKDSELVAYRHEGFWQSMDSMRDKVLLEDLWDSPACPWRIWR
jgi:glucose-1-phosphate cytidylyltransferase